MESEEQVVVTDTVFSDDKMAKIYVQETKLITYSTHRKTIIIHVVLGKYHMVAP